MKRKKPSRTCSSRHEAASYYFSVARGDGVPLAPSTRHTTITQVPALYNKIYDGFRANRRGMSDGKKALADKAIALGAAQAKRR